MRSFKTRIILWTLGISTVVLLAFGGAIDRAYYRLQLESVDEGLRAIAAPVFHPPAERRFWSHYENIASERARGVLSSDMLVIAYGRDPEEVRVIGELPDDDMLKRLPAVQGDLLEPEDVIESLPNRGERPFPPERGSQSRRLRLGGGSDREADFLFTESSQGKWRFSLYKYPGYNVAVGVNFSNSIGSLWQLRHAYLMSLPIALGVLAFGAWFFAQKAIEPIVKLTEVTRDISSTDLSVRIQQAREDREFAELIDVFNAMLARLERSFEQARRFSADAAHELKTPLTILQGNLEQAIQAAPEGSDAQRTLGSLIEETHRLKSITRKLLVLAQADTGRLPLNPETVELTALVEEVFEDMREMGSDVRETWVMKKELSSVCDRSLVTQIFQNIASNALKYRTTDRILVRLFEDGNRRVFEIENDCEPIAEEQREGLFDRFARFDNSRNRKIEGTGLGLSLAREYARAQGGDLTIPRSSDPSKIVFKLVLPATVS